jgi:hypothetical protein
MTPGHPAQTRGQDTHQPGGLVHPEFHEPEVTQLSHALPGIVFLHGPAEQPVVRVLADARQRPDQDIERFRGRPPIWRSARSSSHGR